MYHLDLFSGIGGFALAARRVGWETVGFCEIEPYCQKVLAKHWPGVPIHNDVTNLKYQQNVDLVTAGFPCPDISLAGKGAGISGDRSGLFWYILRTVRMVGRPKLLLENVAALLGRGLGVVLGALAQIGYDTEWHCIPASYVGARQLRDRIWIVANPECDSVQGWTPVSEAWGKQSREEQLAGLVQPCAWPTVSESRNRGAGDGIPNRIHRNKALGNAIVPQCAELIFNAIKQLEETNGNTKTQK